MRTLPGSITLKISRENIFESAYEAIMYLPAIELKKRLMIQMDTEEGLDYGGVSREFFFLLGHEMLNPNCASSD